MVRDREPVRPCVFLGRLSATGTAEGEAEQEGPLRWKTAELGGDVLLLLPGGVGEAYSCKGRPFIFGEEPDRRPTAIQLAPAPTPTPGA